MRNKNILKALSLLAAVCITAGCNGSAVTETTTLPTTTVATENTTTNTKKNAITEPREEVLPEGLTMDELRNILVINGKTLTMPTTLNKIMELDEKFSYEAEYIEEGDYLYNGTNGFYVDVLYDNINMFTAAFPSEKNDINQILNSNLNTLTFASKGCRKTDISIETSCGLNFMSSYEDIVNIFGEPNTDDFQDTIKTYIFSDDTYEYCAEFSLNTDNMLSRIKIQVKSN